MEQGNTSKINICRSIVPHENEYSVINSKTSVKLQTVKSPGKFAKLQCNTNLNLPPSNWLKSTANSYGLQQAITESTGYTSFRMAHMFPDCLGEIDVVSSAENIKNLLKLPYSGNCSISLMIHRIENTLLIDEFDIHDYLLRRADDDWNWLKSYIYEHILTISDNDRKRYLKDFTSEEKNAGETLLKNNLLSKFLYHSLSRNDDEPNKADSSSSNSNKQNTISELRPLHLAGPLLPDPSIEENVPDPKTNHIYNRNFVWTFEDIRMLIGTDMPIFGSANRPCISLRLRDMSKPINVLTGIDYWLDNLMCNVPEVVMCYHLDGLVQKYEIIKTEDLPYLEDSKFSPKVIRNVAQNILAFLKQNATKAGHTYWLFKGKNDEFVKLYDLTSLCTIDVQNSTGTTNNDGVDASNESAANENNDNGNDGGKNPFTVPVAMLLYKVARNMKNMYENMSAQQAGSIKMLLDNCIKLLPKEKYPQIVTSSHYILSDLLVPAGMNPSSPNVSWASDDSSDVYNKEFDADGSTNGNSSNENNSNEDNISANGINSSEVDNSGSEHSIVTKNILETANEFNLEKNWKHNFQPEPINIDLNVRCRIALEHIVSGLSCLQYFSSTEEKLTEEKAKAEFKRKIILEELNPTMAKSNEAIPLPYEKLKPDQKVDSKKCNAKETQVKEPPVAGSSKKSKKHKRGKAAKQKSQKQQQKPSSAPGDDYNDIEQEDSNSPRSLLLKGKSGIIESWNIHLKLLLLEKACLIYATLTEQSYHMEQYGIALKYIFIALKCQRVVTKHMSSISSQTQCLLGRAGDCYFQLAKNLNAIDENILQFCENCAIDVSIKHELNKDISTDGDDDDNELPMPVGSIEKLMLFSCLCYKRALKYSTAKSKREFLGRMGSVCNELGVRYMNWAQEEYNKYIIESNDTKNASIYQMFIRKSYDCFRQGILSFEETEDNANLSILLCNMGRFMRFRAHVLLPNEGKDDIELRRTFYESAFKNYTRALGILEYRKQNPVLWDLVNWELSSGKYALVLSLIDLHTKQDCETKNVVPSELIEMMLIALKFCEFDIDVERKLLYQQRAASIYQRLGGIYHRNYAENQCKKTLQLALMYFEKSSKLYDELNETKNYLHVLIDRLIFQRILFESIQGVNSKINYLEATLKILKKSQHVLNRIDNSSNLEDDDEMVKLLKDIVKELQFTLKHLIKNWIKSSDQNKLINLKNMYKFSLKSPAKCNVYEMARHLNNALNIALVK